MKAFMDMMIGGLIDALVPGCSTPQARRAKQEAEEAARKTVTKPTGNELIDNWHLYINADSLHKHGFHTAKKVN